MSKKVIIVGAGHNGLVCGTYLAKAGFDVTLLERRSIPGGAAVTEEFHPGFRNSTASYTVSLLDAKIISDMNLLSHGLEILPRRVENYLPLENGDSFASYADHQSTLNEIKRINPSDVAKLNNLNQLLSSVVQVIRDQLLVTPPLIHQGGIPDLLKLFKINRSFNKLSRREKQFLTLLFTRSAGEILEDHLDSETLQAWLGFDSVVGNYASPYHPGSGYVLLHHLLGQVAGKTGSWGHALGGMGAIIDAMIQESRKYGVDIRVDSEVSRILITSNKARGVELCSGEVIKADLVVANVTPKMLFLKMIDQSLVSDEIREHFQQFKCVSGTFRMNVALSELPVFETRPVDHYLESGIIIAPSLAYMDKAYQHARERGWSKQPIIELLIPSTIDATLAPSGQQVASLFCQHFDPGLNEKWDHVREEVADQIISVVSHYAPNFSKSILARQIHSPRDLEQKFGLTGGDIFHGRLSLDQLFSARPMIGMSQYRTQFPNLYMCGSGTHPGGGVSGIPGHNAAREIIRQCS